MHFFQIDSESYSENDLSNDARYNKGSTSLISPAIETDKGFDHDYNLQNTYSNKESIAALALLNLITHEKGNVKSGDLNPNSGEFHINSNQSEEKIKEYSSDPDDIATCCNTRRMKAVPFPVKVSFVGRSLQNFRRLTFKNIEFEIIFSKLIQIL